MKKYGIITALTTEVDLLKKRVEELEEIVLGKHTIYKGLYKKQEVYFVVSGVGKVNAAITTQRLIDFTDLDYLINIGIAGGLQDHLQVLDTVLAEELTYHDFSHRFMEDYFPFISSFYSSKDLLEKSERVLENVYYGKIISGDQFIESNEEKSRLAKDFQALCVEMEGASIAHTAYVNGIPFLVVRTISDLANDQAEMTYSEFEQKAADKSCDLVLKLIGNENR